MPRFAAGERATRIEVVRESSLAAAERLCREGHRPSALNFASAKHPGGGFLNGAVAQEESLCRSSALYACLFGNPMYAVHARDRDGFYTNYAIYSPNVPVFFTDAGNPLPRPYFCSFVTAPAVNAGRYLDGVLERVAKARTEMARRVAKVLAIMAAHDHDAAVLGAWGCGVFRNDPTMIADVFGEALDGPFRGVFERVMFAVLDSTDDLRVWSPFAERFVHCSDTDVSEQ